MASPRRVAETEDERSSPTSQPGWASSFARSSSSSGGGGAGVGSGTGSGWDDPCPPDTRKSCDDLDSSLCKMIIDIADKLLGDRTGVGPIEPIVKPCEDAIKVTKKSRELLWLMCQTPHLLDTYRRACKDNELTFCPFCHPSPKPTTNVTQIAPY
jgi:hypothetical protein